jgi:hypothetical protein
MLPPRPFVPSKVEAHPQTPTPSACPSTTLGTNGEI